MYEHSLAAYPAVLSRGPTHSGGGGGGGGDDTVIMRHTASCMLPVLCV